mmetsp:Transcript_18706/g.37956  ORF Transcript_18706/g.37956 Transcript_18706/m.37956 type:complete len:441 (-) Transcript_18706:109-1431(-)
MAEDDLPDFQINVLKNVGIGQAATHAIASLTAKKASAPSAKISAKRSMDILQAQVVRTQAILDLLALFSNLNDENKLYTVFDLLDKEGCGLIDVSPLVNGFRAVGGDQKFGDIMARAAVTLEAVEKKGSRLKCSDFQRFLNTVLAEADCSLNDIAELLVTHVVFPDFVPTELETPVFEDRIDSLFMLFDTNGDGQLDKKEVSAGFVKMTDRLDEPTKIAWSALLLVTEENENALNYQEFVELLLNMAATAKMEFNGFADLATLSLCRPKENVAENLSYLFMGNDLKKALAEMEQVKKDTGIGTVDVVQYGRMQRLFRLWDLDRDGTIDLSEMLLGMRKFQEAKKVSITVEECISAMLAFDTDDDAKLDVTEFAGFLIKFADATNVGLTELVDFMVVTSALKDNNDAENEYIKAIGKKATEAIMRRKGRRSFGRSFLQIVS